tara:strand:+ start:1069 stop:1938 length:870 start_codon:yes stop_codon:yes gene_type:complete
VIKYKYFFGSDKRSVPYLEVLIHSFDNLKVVTVEPKQSGRGRKLKLNPVEQFAVDNNIPCIYYSENQIFEDMEIGIVVSFQKIFSEKFLSRHKNLFNIHLSILPNLRGPSPVETALLNNYSETGLTIFKIDTNIDKGPIYFQEKIFLDDDYYASDIYLKAVDIFSIKLFKIFEILENKYFKPRFQKFGSDKQIQEMMRNTDFQLQTYKFLKSDFDITDCSSSEAKLKIRAFNVIGPAYLKIGEEVLKIHSYINKNEYKIYLKDDYIYPDMVTPSGKKKMHFSAYKRGLR